MKADQISPPGLRELLAYGQGGYFFLTGIWPLLHGSSFQALTGWKADFWLAQTVGLLLATVGATLVWAARRRSLSRELMVLAGMQAAVLGFVDLYCVHQPRATPAYLLDAVVEFAIVAAWIFIGRAPTRHTADSAGRRLKRSSLRRSSASAGHREPHA
jgi:hypothetical protein